MKNLIIAIIVLLSVSTASLAATTKSNTPMCLTEDKLDQLVKAAVASDERAFLYLLDNGCVLAKAGLPITVIKVGWLGTSKVRVYLDSGAVEVWISTSGLDMDANK